MNFLSLQADDPTSRFIPYFSSWRKLKTSVAWFLKLKAILLDLSQRRKEFETSLPAADVVTFTKTIQENMNRVRDAVCTQTLSVNDLFKAENAISTASQKDSKKESTPWRVVLVVKTKSDIYKLDPVLKNGLLRQSLDNESLQTFLSEVEAILNDRPITTVSGDANDLEALTPHHILLLKGNPILAPFEERDCYIRKRWKQVQYLADLFWKRWTREYLPLLQGRQRWSKPQRSFAVGDIVVVMDQTATRGSWILARIL
uniref:DUF5641 domain-containing protein n=1 Tax=Nothobranchius korthausae TaxID=1143690 RepID=A0A1A8EYY3_9TELE